MAFRTVYYYGCLVHCTSYQKNTNSSNDWLTEKVNRKLSYWADKKGDTTCEKATSQKTNSDYSLFLAKEHKVRKFFYRAPVGSRLISSKIRVEKKQLIHFFIREWIPAPKTLAKENRRVRRSKWRRKQRQTTPETAHTWKETGDHLSRINSILGKGWRRNSDHLHLHRIISDKWAEASEVKARESPFF